MICAAEFLEKLRGSPNPPRGYDEPSWYAAYTCANHEKRVSEQLEHRSVESFLPLYESLRSWKDRRIKLELPLFPGYVFVHLPLRERLRVLEISGVVRLVGFSGTAVALPDEEIAALRSVLAKRIRVEPFPYLCVGRRVRVKSGPLKDCTGIAVRLKRGFRLVLSLEQIFQSAIAEVDIADVECLE